MTALAAERQPAACADGQLRFVHLDSHGAHPAHSRNSGKQERPDPSVPQVLICESHAPDEEEQHDRPPAPLSLRRHCDHVAAVDHVAASGAMR